MLGVGIWEVPINSFFYKGTAKIIVKDNNGEYDFRFEVPGFKVPEMEISDVHVEKNTLTANATCEMLKGKKLFTKVEFENDECKGFVKGPYNVKIAIKGKKIG